MQVLAKRDKRLNKYYLILSLFSTLLGIILFFNYSKWCIILLILGVIATIFTFYLTFITPENVIVKNGDKLILNLTFYKKEIDISNFQYATHNERSIYHNYRRTSLFLIKYIHENDIRTLIITIKENGTLKHLRLYNILNASAVALSINSVKENY